MKRNVIARKVKIEVGAKVQNVKSFNFFDKDTKQSITVVEGQMRNGTVQRKAGLPGMWYVSFSIGDLGANYKDILMNGSALEMISP